MITRVLSGIKIEEEEENIWNKYKQQIWINIIFFNIVFGICVLIQVDSRYLCTATVAAISFFKYYKIFCKQYKIKIIIWKYLYT